MSELRIAYVINDVAFFVSHRLPLAKEVLKLGTFTIKIVSQFFLKEKKSATTQTNT